MNRHVKVAAVLQIATALGLIVFWTLFFTVGLASEGAPVCYFAYEKAFPLPDALLALGLGSAGVLVFRRKPQGRTLSLCCAGALVFLGLLDFSFNVQNGIYVMSVADLVINAFINLWSVALGVYVYRVIRKESVT